MNFVRTPRAMFARASLVCVCLSVSMLSANPVVALQRSGPPVQQTSSQQQQLPKLMATAQKTFQIPFSVNAKGNETVEVILQLSVDRGKTWQAYSRRAANAKSFPFSAPQEGEYWFAIQSINRNGAKSPTDQRLKPELRIAVDTAKPTFEFNVRPDAAGRVVGNWTATDPHIDTCSMKIEYQSQGGQWIAVPTNSCRKAQHSTFRDELAWWPDTTSPSLQVRATIKDLAGNASQVTRNVTLPLIAQQRGQGNSVAQKQPIMTNYQRSRLPVALAHLYGDSPDPSSGGSGQQPRQAANPLNTVPQRPAQKPATSRSQQANPSQQPASPRSSRMVPPQPPRSSNRFANNQVGPASSGVPSTNTGSQTWNSQKAGTSKTSGPAQVQVASTHQSVQEGKLKVPADPNAGPNAQWRRRSDSAPRVAQAFDQQNQNVAVGSTSRFPRAGETRPSQRLPVQSNPVRRQPLPTQATPAGNQGMQPVAKPQQLPRNVNTPPQTQAQSQVRPHTQSQPPATGSALNAQWASSTTGAVERPPQPATTLASGPMLEGLRKKARPSSSRRFQMEYGIDAIGPDGVKEVQLWMTSDGGNSWRKHSLDADQRSPINAEVTSDGIYGFRILVVSNDGLRARSPKRGDPADMWVNVDTNAPTVKITGVPYGRNNEAGKLLIQWQAADANLSMRPVRLQYSPSQQGPWTTVEDGIRNEGQYAWKPAANIPDQVYLRLQVRDTAGNVKTETMNRPVDISGLIPRGRIRGLTPLNEPSSQDSTT